MNEPTIKKIELTGFDNMTERLVTVTLSNGTQVKITGMCGGFEQYNCTQREMYITLDIAHRFTRWLNGEKL